MCKLSTYLALNTLIINLVVSENVNSVSEDIFRNSLIENSLKLTSNEDESSRKIKDTAPAPSLNYMLMPALTIAGIVPWIVPGIRLLAGFVQFVNQAAFMAGLGALVRSYIFDAKPDEHVVYVNPGYGPHGHTEHHHN